MTRRRRRLNKYKETMHSKPKAKIHVKNNRANKLQSTKKVQLRKKKLPKTTIKKSIVKKIKEKPSPKTEEVPCLEVDSPVETPVFDLNIETPAVAAEEIIVNNPGKNESVEPIETDEEGMLIIDERNDEEIKDIHEDENNSNHIETDTSELNNQIVDENHNKLDGALSASTENEMDDENMKKIYCLHCLAIVDSVAALTIHMKQHSISTNKINKCLICLRYLSSDSSLDRHMLTHSGERPYKCKHCNMAFTTNGNMNRHQRVHQEEKNGKSLDLSKKTVKRSLSEAIAISEDSESLSKSADLYCLVCNKGFMSPYGLDNHMRCHPNNPIMCQNCNTITSNYAAYVKHKCETIEIKSPEKCKNGKLQQGFDDLTFMEFSNRKFPFVSKVHCEQNIKRPISAFEIFDCKVCSRVFPCQQALKLHQKCHESKIITYCATCKCDFESPGRLQIHKLNHRSVESCPSPPIQRNETVQASQNDVHNGKEDFLALLKLKTNEPVSTIGNFEAYIKEEPCDNYDYFVFGKLRKKETTTVELEGSNKKRKILSNEIDGCNNDFADIQSIISLTSKAPLISTAHTSPISILPASPISLTTLPKSPSIAESANASPETPSRDEVPCASVSHDVPIASDKHEMYACKICSQQFKKKSTLKRHSQNHKVHVQRGTNYACHICSYVSVDKSTLIRHLRTHNGERPFQCVICMYAFTTKANCERHVKQRHKIVSKAEIRKAMRYNPNMSYKSGAEPSTADDGNSETVCKYCKEDFKNNRVLRHHLRSLHNSCNRKPYYCKLCKAGFSTKNNCIRHVLRQHPALKDKVISLVVPNNLRPPTTSSEIMSSTDNSNSNSNSSTDNQSVTAEEPLDLHCNVANMAVDLQVEKNSEFRANETVIAAESLVSLSETLPPQEEPLDLAPQALNLATATAKVLEPKPTSIYNFQPNLHKPAGFIDLTASKSPLASAPPPVSVSIPVPERNLQISPIHIMNEICSKKIDFSNKTPPTNPSSNPPGQKRRSFTCRYCSAGFTLKSNMERHIKRKHPEYARPTRSRNFIPSIVTPNLQKQNSTMLSDKTRDALRQVLSTKVQQVPVFKPFSTEILPRVGSTFKIVGPSRSFLTPLTQLAGPTPILNLSLDLNSTKEKVAIVDLKPTENNDENCSDLASVSSLICTANSPQFKQYLGKPADIEKLEEINGKTPQLVEKNENLEVLPDANGQKKRSKVNCPYCERKFPWSSSLRRHVLTHTGQKPHKCSLCQLYFTTKSNCERHLIRKHGHKGDLITRSVPDRPYKCNFCLTSTFSTQGNLRKHFYLKHWKKNHKGINWRPVQFVKKSSNIESFSQVKIPENNVSSVTTQEHSYSQLEKKLPFACNFCDNSFKTITDIRSHMLNHNSVLYICYLCRKTFANHEECNNHFKTSHSLVHKQINSIDENGMKWSSDEDNFEDISETASPEKGVGSFACMICFQKVSSVENLQLHFKRHLSKDKLTDNQEKIFKESDSSSIKSPAPSTSKLPSNNLLKKPRVGIKNKSINSLLHLLPSGNIKSELVPAEEESDLIQKLLGIPDKKVLDECLVSPDSAARLLGVKKV
ncbi:ras-responsive element-binding protein 1 [Caerostris darwini]|uniref:Ras-responsive element-binding protein 1 n=1 Tax=Caerostris darwini TaxID=1538125 RepID=A0AAV4N7A2_9ARAC|nr:ras-responsive element-binding protein 1 [Caerostris darwini]